MTYRVLKKYINPKERQKEVNRFFIETVTLLFNDIIDEANDLCYREFKLYPNIYTIRLMRDRMKDIKQVEVSLKQDDFKNIEKDF